MKRKENDTLPFKQSEKRKEYRSPAEFLLQIFPFSCDATLRTQVYSTDFTVAPDAKVLWFTKRYVYSCTHTTQYYLFVDILFTLNGFFRANTGANLYFRSIYVIKYKSSSKNIRVNSKILPLFFLLFLYFSCSSFILSRFPFQFVFFMSSVF